MALFNLWYGLSRLFSPKLIDCSCSRRRQKKLCKVCMSVSGILLRCLRLRNFCLHILIVNVPFRKIYVRNNIMFCEYPRANKVSNIYIRTVLCRCELFDTNMGRQTLFVVWLTSPALLTFASSGNCPATPDIWIVSTCDQCNVTRPEYYKNYSLRV